MTHYRKKPVVVEAMRFDGRNQAEVFQFLGEGLHQGAGSNGILIRTLEGGMRADVGDWIIRGIKGEYYPCKPDIFEATYEPVGEEEGMEMEGRRF